MSGMDEIMASAIPAILSQAALFPDEYAGDDGVARCKRCHGRRQLDVELLGAIRRVRCMCRCQSEEYDRAHSQPTCLSASRMAESIPASLLLPGVSECTFDIAEKVVGAAHVATARRYADSFEDMRAANTGLLLFGPPSCGKTLVACAVANRVRRFGYTTLVTSMTRLVNELCDAKGTNRNRLVDAVCARDLLVIDDFGSERSTSLAREQSLLTVDTRMRRQLPLIVTTNLGLSEMRGEEDIERKRVYDRVLEMCRPTTLPERNLRAEAAAANQLQAKELLS